MAPVVRSQPPPSTQTGVIDWADNNDADGGKAIHTSSSSHTPRDHFAEQDAKRSDPASTDSGASDKASFEENDDEENSDRDMGYSSSSSDDESDDDSTTLVEDTTSLPILPAHERDLLSSLTTITQSYSDHVFAQNKRTINLLVAYERGGLELVTRFGTCRQDEVVAAENAVQQVKKETGEALGRILQEVLSEQEQVNELRKALEENGRTMEKKMKKESEMLGNLFALC